MPQRSWALLAGLLLVLPGTTPAAEPALAGNWKVTLLVQDSQPTFWLIQLAQKDGKWTGKVLSSGEVEDGKKLPAADLQDLSVTADLIRFNLKMAQATANFEGKLPPDKAGN